MRLPLLALFASLPLLPLPSSLHAAPVFETDIRPLLKTHCFHCHGEGGRKEAGLDLRLRRFIVQGSPKNGPAISPRNPQSSHLLDAVRSGDMPKDAKPLAPSEITLLESWIAAGAPTLRDEPTSIPDVYITDEERRFWSFQPIASPPIPPGQPNPIDAFIAAKLHAANLDFLPPADPRTLIRRASFDLLGLPPSPEQTEAFVAACSPPTPENLNRALDSLVDQLLTSPHYAERWGRHWLDAAGYADSNGHDDDSLRPHAWHYRDYVVRAHSSDMPWNRFLTEQLAGDELAGVSHDSATAAINHKDNTDLLAATGFLRMAPDPTDASVADPDLARNQVLADTIKTVSSSLMGLTVACAQCHDHRYDPISHADYHRLRAVFEPLYNWKQWRQPAQRLYSLYSPEERAKAAAIESEAAAIDASRSTFALNRLDEIFAERLAKVPDPDREAVRTARNTEDAKRTPEQVALLKQYVEANVARNEGLLLLFDPPAEAKRKEMEAKAAALRATKPTEHFLMAATESGPPPPTFRFHRGDHLQPREEISPAVFEVLSQPIRPLLSSQIKDIPSSGRRLAFAHWLTSPENPLTPRVLVNRFWLHHFGRSLVPTPGDFGALGSPPTHPDLLDWLANDFTSHNWQLKRLHKLILTSRTWQQSHDPHPSTDRENLYCGWKLQRLDAESLRDAMLSVSGRLNPLVGGEPIPVARDVSSGRIIPGREIINPGNGMIDKIDSVATSADRRSLYIQARRSRPLTVLDTFDLPVMNPNCTSRTLSTVAPQSLLLMNDSFTVDIARSLAARLQKDTPENDAARISRAWALLFNAPPSQLDSARSLVFLHRLRSAAPPGSDPAKADSDALTAWAQLLLATNRFLYVD
jgi:hypothetical protein